MFLSVLKQADVHDHYTRCNPQNFKSWMMTYYSVVDCDVLHQPRSQVITLFMQNDQYITPDKVIHWDMSLFAVCGVMFVNCAGTLES